MKTLGRLPNWIGDAVMATPALRLLIEHSGGEGVSMWGPPKTAALFHSFPGVHQVFEIDEKLEFARLEEIRREGFSEIYLFTNSYSTALAAKQLGIPSRIGYRREWRGLLLTRRVFCSPRIRYLHMVDFYLHLLPSEWRMEPLDRQPRLHLSEEETALCHKRFEEIAGPLKDNVVGIAPGAAFGSAKQWEPEWFRGVAEEMARRDRFVMVFGTESERDLGDFILSGLPAGKGRNLAAQSSLRELLGYLSLCRCLLTNDSGPMHLADAMGTPVVALFGSTDSSWTGPWAGHHKVLQSEVPCSPCFLRECPIDRRCMRSLNVDRVLDALETVLAMGSSRA
jgi:heptosyltransferase-2